MNNIYNPIAVYNYKGKKYFIALDNNEIVYFKYENNNITNEYTIDELRIFMKVYNSIKINKDTAICLGVREFNGKKFETYYDRATELYFWYEIVDGKKCTPSRADLELLDLKYNDVKLVYADERKIYDWSRDVKFLNNDENQGSEKLEDGEKQENNQKDGNNNQQSSSNEEVKESKFKNKIKTITRNVVDGVSVITIVLVAGYGLVTLSDNFLGTGIKDKITEVIGISDENGKTSYDDEVYKFEKIENAIDRNQNLSDEEKEFIKKMKYYFDSNFYHLSVPFIEERLSTLKVKYVERECEDPKVGGEYVALDNEITMYSASSFENCDKSFFTHEVMHSVQRGSSKRLLGELSNELTTRELLRAMYDEGLIDKNSGLKRKYGFNAYGIGYPQCMKIYYLLSEVLDSSTLKSYQTSLNDSIIVDELVKIEKEHGDGSNSEEEMVAKAISLLDEIDELRTYNDGKKYMTVNYTEEKYKSIRDEIDYYYRLKFGKSIDENIYTKVIEYDETVGSIPPTVENVALAKTVRDILKERYDDYDENETPPLGDDRYVVARSYLSGDHKYPILYTSMTKSSGNVIFEGIEITPEVEEKYKQRLNEIENYNKNVRYYSQKLSNEDNSDR